MPTPPTLTEDTVNRRLLLKFDAMPDPEVSRLVRREGWSYRGGIMKAWVRPVSEIGRQSARFIIAQLSPRTPADNA